MGGKQIVVISGPSGSGKNTMIREILSRFQNTTKLVTATTRPQRPGEMEGIDHYFFDQQRFDDELGQGNILEQRYVPELGTYYGIYKPDLDKRVAMGKTILAEVDLSGALYLKETHNATTIFIMPESLTQFRARIKRRNPDMSEREFEARMRITEEEIRVHASQYDYRIVSADGALQETLEELIRLIQTEGYTL